MKVKEVLVSLAGVLILLSAETVFAEEITFSEQKTPEVLQDKTQSDSNQAFEDVQKMRENQYKAWKSFCEAKNSTSADVRSEAYANAIKCINDSLIHNETRPELFLLASRIYRGVGGASYAKKYFSQATAIYLDDVMRNPESIEANLKAAIVLYAGDVQYWETYSESRKKAIGYANRVLALCNEVQSDKIKKADASPVIDKQLQEEAVALSYLVKGDMDACQLHLEQAKDVFDKVIAVDFVNCTDSGFIKVEQIGNGQEKTKQYLPYEIFMQYPKQGKWYWPVAKQENACKEFLLNCVTGFYL